MGKPYKQVAGIKEE